MIFEIVFAISFAAVAVICWREHKRAIERATVDSASVERKRVSQYLRGQSRIAETVSKCRYLSDLGREQEAYAAAVLEETAAEIAELAHWRVS